MKKNIIIATIAVASAFILAVSCQKQEISISENTNDSEIVAFSATINQESTKTVLVAGSDVNKFKVNWESTDKISIKGADYSVSSIKDDATKAIFSGNGAIKEDSKYKAIYPSSLYKTDHFELPSIQTYAAGKFNAPMYAESETESLAFKNICGVLCLSLKGDSNDKIKYITVIANEGVCGKFTMGNDAATLSLSSTVGEYSRTVSLDCGEGVQLDNTTAKDFYIYLPPKTYTAGMKIIITTTDSKVFETITAASATIERNNIYTFNNWALNFQPKPTLLSGVFTVGEGKTVQFTKGNLWADGSNALHFEDGQWNGVPSGSSKDESHIFHFTWSDNVTSAVGNDNSGTYLFCNESHKQTVDTQAGCYALSKDEWSHLFNGRTNATDKYGYATVNNVNGIIILPDTFNDPYAGIKVFTPSSTTEWAANEYSEAGWIAMEAAGAAFLPAAGHREGPNIIINESSYGNVGNYWSSSSISNEKYPYLVSFFNSRVSTEGYKDHNLKCGCSLRLVTDTN